MNRREKEFICGLSRTASILADFLENCQERDGAGALGDALWRSMYYFDRDVRQELEGLLSGSAADDCFEISGWFERMRCAYGKYSQVLTFCQILCSVFRTGCVRDGAGALRLLARAVGIGTMSGSPPDMIPVWQFLIRRSEAFFGSGGNDGSSKESGGSGSEADKKAMFGRMLAQLCCCAGDDRKYTEHMKMIFCFINAFASGPAEREKILAAVHSGAAYGDPRLFIALEAAYG
ncbi:MAG: hypothetical protein J5950_03650 [Clostridia bacterium]|nr:hypothetical protein [Clostridia bacterium]